MPDDPDDPVRVRPGSTRPRGLFPAHGPGEAHPAMRARAALLFALVALLRARQDEQGAP